MLKKNKKRKIIKNQVDKKKNIEIKHINFLNAIKTF